jgi:hypothetical protein
MTVKCTAFFISRWLNNQVITEDNIIEGLITLPHAIFVTVAYTAAVSYSKEKV